MPEHLDDPQAAAFVLDHFQRQVAAELAVVTIAVKRKNNRQTVLVAKCEAEQALESTVVAFQRRLPSLPNRFAIAVVIIDQSVHWRGASVNGSKQSALPIGCASDGISGFLFHR